MSRRPHKPNEQTRKLVRQYYGAGTPQEDIASVLEISVETLVKYYRKDMDEALVKANLAVAGALHNKARSGDTAAIIWWEKTRAGKSDKLALGGQADNPIRFKDETDVKQKVLKALTDEQLKSILTGDNSE